MSSEEEQGQLSTNNHFISKIYSILDVSLVIPNKVSMARDQLANERNYLTFLRFSCTLIVLGFTMLIQFRLPYKTDFNEPSSNPELITKPIGYCFVAVGFTMFIFGLSRYFVYQRSLIRETTFIQAGWFSMLVMTTVGSFFIGVMILASLQSAAFTKHPR